MPYYRAVADLEADLERVIRDRYHGDRWEFSGLFEDDALAYWLRTGLSAEQILLGAIGRPQQTQATA